MSIFKHIFIIYFFFQSLYNTTMKNKQKRLETIEKLLQIEHSMKISDLSIQLGVSPMTTRRDIEILSQRGVLKVLHGAVVYNPANDSGGLSDYMLALAETQNIDKKKAISRYAVSLIEEDDIIFIDAGSTTEAFAQMLPTDIPLTVVCYSINIFLAIAGKKNIDILLIGGHFNRQTTILEPHDNSDILHKNRTRKAFISAGGIHSKLGVTCANQSECSIKHEALNSCIESFLLVDSSKFGSVHTCYFADPADFNKIITNNDVSEEYKKYVIKNKIHVNYV